MKKYSIIIFVLLLLCIPAVTYAATGFFAGTDGDICTYFKNLYNFGVIAAGIVAAIAITIGGVFYMASGGNQERVGTAKQIILGAVGGLILILVSYVLFNTLAPNVLNCKMENIGVTLPSGGTGSTGSTGGTSKVSPTVKFDRSKALNFPRQSSQEMVNIPYHKSNCVYDGKPDSNGRKKGTVASAGCGVISTYIVLKGYGVNVSVKEVADYFVSSGYRGCDGGTQHAAFTKGVEKWGLEGKEVSFETAKNAAASGRPIIIRKTGHIMVIAGYDNGKFLVYDPEQLLNRHNKWFDEKTLKE
ncbi:C39 family peptidase, partial [Patescibacteria group bacterium]|nr:C39 family peptidase [Patescibacteria group bacterium]